jgi:hypothetical protein
MLGYDGCLSAPPGIASDAVMTVANRLSLAVLG